MSIFKSIMYSHKWKPAGLAVTIAGALAMGLERLHGFVIISRYSAEQHFYAFQWIMLFGLFFIIFCKEKHEDERTAAIRAQAFQFTFILQQALLMNFALTRGGQVFSSVLFVACAMGMFLYLFIFYIGLYFDFMVDYGGKRIKADDNSAKKTGLRMLAVILMLFIIVMVGLFFGEK